MRVSFRAASEQNIGPSGNLLHELNFFNYRIATTHLLTRAYCNNHILTIGLADVTLFVVRRDPFTAHRRERVVGRTFSSADGRCYEPASERHQRRHGRDVFSAECLRGAMAGQSMHSVTRQ
jgi:hypothetical protein